ncbi:MAG: heat-inducible transcription repressor HrcA [Coriobacteriia bacterium]|nr:heat-inducible transcription repressor HrcA [Coriobacteriia bacterium]
MEARKNRILFALIQEYISTAVPVGSRTLVDRYDLNCSPATVRNELSSLEERGYLIQPHTSAGRIPTDKGYRLFVDSLVEMRDDVDADASHPFFDTAKLHSLDIHFLMRNVAQALSTYTNLLSITRTPSLENATVKKLDLLSLGANRVLFVLMTDDGQVVNRTIDLKFDASPENVATVQHSLSVAFLDKPANEIAPLREALRGTAESGVITDGLTVCIIDEILDALAQADHEHVSHGGLGALLQQPEFQDASLAQPLVDLLEDGLDIFDLLKQGQECGKAELLCDTSVFVRIGTENSRSELGPTSLVISPYYASGAQGYIGVVGPTRMNYLRSIKAVQRAADELSRITSNLEK